jgi:hypothetical protein
MSKDELVALIPWKSYHDQCQAYYNFSHDIETITDIENSALIHLLSGGWDPPDCADTRKICKELGLPCSCGAGYTEASCGKA